MVRIRFLSLCLLLCSSLFLASLSKGQEKAAAKEKVRITYATNSLAFLVTFTAKDRGFYSKQGLDPELVRVQPGPAIAALLSGDADYAEVLGSAIRSAAKGAPIRAISTSIRAPFFSLAAQPKFKSVKELRGGSVGVTAIGGTNYISTRAVLQHYDVDADREIKIIPIGDESLLYEALKIGRVDAVMLSPPFSVRLQRDGFPLLAHTSQVLSIPFVGLSTTLKKISNNRSQIKKALKAEIEALRYLHRNPAGSVELIRRRFAMDEQTARESYNVVIDAFTKDGRTSPEAVEELLAPDKKDGVIPKTVTVDQVTDLSLIEEALKELGG